jgi:hypothetical protein
MRSVHTKRVAGKSRSETLTRRLIEIADNQIAKESGNGSLALKTNEQLSNNSASMGIQQERVSFKRKSRTTHTNFNVPVRRRKTRTSIHLGTSSLSILSQTPSFLTSDDVYPHELALTTVGYGPQIDVRECESIQKRSRLSTSKSPNEYSNNRSNSPEDLKSERSASNGHVCPLGTNITLLPKSQRRKKLILGSPYFKAMVLRELSSPLTTPTPKKPSDKKSKISIAEKALLPSFPHSRPTSPDEFGLIQEKLRHDPWRMLVAVIFLNVTTAKTALPLLAKLFDRWPTPEALSNGINPLENIADRSKF